MNTTTLTKWGNGQGVRLSKDTMEKAGLHVGDSLEIHTENGKITLLAAKKRYIDVLDYRHCFGTMMVRLPKKTASPGPSVRSSHDTKASLWRCRLGRSRSDRGP